MIKRPARCAVTPDCGTAGILKTFFCLKYVATKLVGRLRPHPYVAHAVARNLVPRLHDPTNDLRVITCNPSKRKKCSFCTGIGIKLQDPVDVARYPALPVAP